MGFLLTAAQPAAAVREEVFFVTHQISPRALLFNLEGKNNATGAQKKVKQF